MTKKYPRTACTVRGYFCVESHGAWWMLTRPTRSGSIGYRYPMGKPHN